MVGLGLSGLGWLVIGHVLLINSVNLRTKKEAALLGFSSSSQVSSSTVWVLRVAAVSSLIIEVFF